MIPSNNLKLLVLVIFAPILWLASCSSLTECDQFVKRHAFILLDLSDKELYNEIQSDLKANFPGFMQQTALGSINPCESFTLSFAHLGGQETLDIFSEGISISRRGLSRNEERRLANPSPLVHLMKQKLDEYNRLTDDPVVTSSTSIANVLLKSINHAELESENVFIIMTDGVENNSQLNLYRNIPQSGHSDLIERLIEPHVLDKFRRHQQQGLQAKIIKVLKSEPAGKVDRRKIQAFWIQIFEELKLDYQFVDNLSNKVEI